MIKIMSLYYLCFFDGPVGVVLRGVEFKRVEDRTRFIHEQPYVERTVKYDRSN